MSELYFKFLLQYWDFKKCNNNLDENQSKWLIYIISHCLNIYKKDSLILSALIIEKKRASHSSVDRMCHSVVLDNGTPIPIVLVSEETKETLWHQAERMIKLNTIKCLIPFEFQYFSLFTLYFQDSIPCGMIISDICDEFIHFIIGIA